jgi:hypothetical protein
MVSVHCDFRAPEALAEALFSSAPGLRESALAVVLSEYVRQLSGGHEGGKRVTLDLTERYGALGKPAVGVEYGVMRVFPPLLDESIRGVALIFDESIVIPGWHTLEQGCDLGDPQGAVRRLTHVNSQYSCTGYNPPACDAGWGDRGHDSPPAP